MKSIADRIERLERNLLPDNGEDFERINISGDTPDEDKFHNVLYNKLNKGEKNALWQYEYGKIESKYLTQNMKNVLKITPAVLSWKVKGEKHPIRFTIPLELNDALELARVPTPETEKAGLTTREDRAWWYMRQEPKFFRKCVGYKRYLEIKKL